MISQARATLAATCAVALLVACGQQSPGDKPVAASPQTGAASNPTAQAGKPDVGVVERVHVSASGVGASAAEAVDQALRQAIMQVTGTTIDLSSTQFKTALGAAVGREAITLSSAGFAELVSQTTRGAVTNFKVVSLDAPGLMERVYKASIEADVAKFKAPADTGKLRIAIAPLRIGHVGGNNAERIAAELRQRITDALTQSGRFTVLERGDAPELYGEIERIASGEVSNDQFSKIGQGLGADLIWFGSVNAFETGRPTDADQTGRAGRWSVSQKFVNVTTREVLFSNTVDGGAAEQSGDRVDAMESAVVRKVVADILVRLYPVSIASRDGYNVVLSQGGQSVRQGATYQVVRLGKELTDPQTGRSLGFTEQECCTVVVDRVTASMSYGHLESVKINLDEVKSGELQLRAEAVSRNEPAGASSAAAKGWRKVVKKSAQLGPPTSDANW